MLALFVYAKQQVHKVLSFVNDTNDENGVVFQMIEYVVFFNKQIPVSCRKINDFTETDTDTGMIFQGIDP